MKIIQVDQFTSTGNIESLDFETVELSAISGGDSQAAKAIFGGSFDIREVDDNDGPRIGYVWFKKGEDGKCKSYKFNYDSSD